MIPAKEIKAFHKLEDFVRQHGVVLKPDGNQLVGLCPFHKEKSPSFKVDPKKQVYHCFGCHAGGDIISFISATQGISVKDAMDKLTPEHLKKSDSRPSPSRPAQVSKTVPEPSTAQPEPVVVSEVRGKITKVYQYTDELGTVIFEVCRIEPGKNGKKKDFLQRHYDESGNIVWGMTGVRRVLYNLPNVLKATAVCLCAGEKDADTINSFGWITATTNSGGEDKWLDAYSETLAGKEIIIFGDNDDTGRKHVKRVIASLAGKVKNIRVVYVPKGKDVTDFVEEFRKEVMPDSDICTELEKLVSAAIPLTKGIDLPIHSVYQRAVMYRNSVMDDDKIQLDFKKALPALGKKIRPARRGEVITIIAPTGVGKTNLGQILALSAAPLPTLFFELEISEELIHEREVGIHENMGADDVERAYKAGNDFKFNLNAHKHVYTCPLSRITPAQIESYINQAELVMGERPVIVVVDYAQLVGGVGDRYERVSSTAEELRIIARATNTIIILTSQVGRKEGAQFAETNLQSGKESGSLENSSRLLLGMYMDKDMPNKIWIKIEKDTKGRDNMGYKWAYKRLNSMRLVELSTIEDADIPVRTKPKQFVAQEDLPPTATSVEQPEPVIPIAPQSSPSIVSHGNGTVDYKLR